MYRNKMVQVSLLCLLLGMLSACSDFDLGGEPKQRTDNVNFYQHWVNSYEEQTPGNLVFRPAGSREFPESRFRMEYLFNTDGSCQYKFLSPTDNHRMENCVFTKVGNKVYIYDDAGALRADLSFTFNTLGKDVMNARKGVEKPQAAVAGDKSAATKGKEK